MITFLKMWSNKRFKLSKILCYDLIVEFGAKRSSAFENIFFKLLLVFRVGRQSHRVPYAHHHEERQGDRRHVVGLWRFRQHGARGRDRVRVDAGRKKNYEAGPDPPQWQQHHDGENLGNINHCRVPWFCRNWILSNLCTATTLESPNLWPLLIGGRYLEKYLC